jgi:hypothetical protein
MPLRISLNYLVYFLWPYKGIAEWIDKYNNRKHQGTGEKTENR